MCWIFHWWLVDVCIFASQIRVKMNFGASKKECILHLLNNIYEKQQVARDDTYDIDSDHEYADGLLLSYIEDEEMDTISISSFSFLISSEICSFCLLCTSRSKAHSELIIFIFQF